MSMTPRMKRLRKAAVASAAVAGALYLAPFVAVFFIATGILDVLRNERKTGALFERYFLGNGVGAWLLSPVNLATDLLCRRNRKIYRLEDFPDEPRKEIEEILSVFDGRKQEIVDQVDHAFRSGRRGMLVYRWYGRRYNGRIAEFNRSFKYIQTIAVSVFEGNESTSYHFGPLRLTLRVLYNLRPVESDDVFLECGHTRHHWHRDPLFIFDDTLMHRSANGNGARRYCAFIDVIRPSPVTPILSLLLVAVSAVAQGARGIFYRRWTMLDAGGTET